MADSRTDAVFYGWIAASAWLTRRTVILGFARPLAVVLSIQLLSWAIDLVRYRRIASFHAYTAKAWGVTLFAATLALFLPIDPAPFLWLAILTGILSNLEGLAIKLVLPKWQHDVPTVWHALRLRRTTGAAVSNRSS